MPNLMYLALLIGEIYCLKQTDGSHLFEEGYQLRQKAELPKACFKADAIVVVGHHLIGSAINYYNYDFNAAWELICKRY